MKKFTLMWLMFCATISAQSKVVLSSLFTDNMVLQQQTDVQMWGMASPGKEVVIRPSWSPKTYTVRTKATGEWRTTLRTPAAGGPYSICLSDGEELILRDILIGEVWFCAGQSNMEMPLMGRANQPIDEAVDMIVRAKPTRPIRICTIEQAGARLPQRNCRAQWMKNTSETVAKTSATAYFFEDYLQQVLDIPVGIIISSWGGTSIQAWMKREVLEPFGIFNLKFLTDTTLIKKPKYKPCMLYNAMIAPAETFTIKGFLWYQGESNRKAPALYRKLQPLFVQMLREAWGQGELPFYYVQIAPFEYDGARLVGTALLREAQLQNLQEIPNSGMVVTMDVGDCGCIHPARKRKVGERLALLALSKSYGVNGFVPDTPVYQSMEVNNGKVYLTFDCGSEGLAPLGTTFPGFEMAGEDRIFYSATARIEKGTGRLEVSCEKVPVPVAVRYCFWNYEQGTLYSRYGIPVASFRTDTWEVKE